MRKRILQDDVSAVAGNDQSWLDLDRIARVDITSEDADHPIESALLSHAGPGWQASGPGEQVICLLFDVPIQLRRILLVFDEQQHARTQEFSLRWSSDGGQSYQPLFRQQYTFSPSGATREEEDYTVSLDGLTNLELRIVPDISGGEARASLARLQLA